MMTLASRLRTITAPAQIHLPRSTEQAIRTANPTAHRPGFLVTLLRALAASMA